jgi:hypothetical protein
MAVKVTISIDDKGNIVKVEDKNGKKVLKSSSKQLNNKMKGKKILNAQSVSIIKSNPCIFICSGGGGYWVCW